jgi:MoxR-like ATPase
MSRTSNRRRCPGCLQAGWALEQATASESSVSAADLRGLSALLPAVDLSGVMEPYMGVVFKVRDLGIAFSDRRAVKVLKLVAASALLCGRMAPAPSDLWVLRYVWDREEQIEPLAALINGVLEATGDEPGRHPLAAVQAMPDGEDLARQLDGLERELDGERLSLAAVARLRERLTDLADRAAWLTEPESRAFVLERARKCLEKLG